MVVNLVRMGHVSCLQAGQHARASLMSSSSHTGSTQGLRIDVHGDSIHFSTPRTMRAGLVSLKQ